MCVFVCACLGFCVVRWWLCWHQPHWMKLILEVVLVSNRQINTGAHTQTQEHHHVVTSTHAQRQTVLGHLVCLLVWVSLWGSVQLVWQQDTDSQTILIFASLLYTHTHRAQSMFILDLKILFCPSPSFPFLLLSFLKLLFIVSFSYFPCFSLKFLICKGFGLLLQYTFSSFPFFYANWQNNSRPGGFCVCVGVHRCYKTLWCLDLQYCVSPSLEYFTSCSFNSHFVCMAFQHIKAHWFDYLTQSSFILSLSFVCFYKQTGKKQWC